MADRLLRPLPLLTLVLCILLSPTAAGQDRPTLPSEQHSRTLQPGSSLPTASLPLVDVNTLRRNDADRNDRITPYRYGTLLETDYRPDQTGVWERLPSGDWLWRFRLQSTDAVSLSLAFTQFDLPEEASLFVYDPDHNRIHGPYTAADATNGAHRTPLVRSDVITVELMVPAGRRSAVDLTIGKVVHGYRSLSKGPTSKAGSCNLDVACDDADPWRDQIRSVGRYTFERNGSALACSGALVNNTAEDGRSLFLTAEHCIRTGPTASTMVFYWNYQNPTCRPQGSLENGSVTNDSLNDQTSSGAILRARYGSTHETGTIAGKPDLALVTVDDIIPTSYNLYLSGWSVEGNQTQEATTIHHPQGHGKRISFDRDPSSLIDYPSTNTCSAPSGTTHLEVANWETGTTEQGSSGAPLFNKNQKIVGVLSGGCAGCEGGGSADDNNLADWYGRLSVGYTKADFQGRTFADVLDPNNTGATTLSGRDLPSPPPATNLRIANKTSTSATLRWEAPVNDKNASAPAAYDLRVQPQASIETRSDFEDARRISGVPSPGPPGTTQSITITLGQDTSYYFGIRALDQSKNASSIVTADQDATPVSTLQIKQAPFPNPAASTARVKVSVEEPQTVKITLYDALGRRVGISRSEDLTPFQLQTIPIDVSSLSSGVYFLRIKSTSTTRTEKVVVRR